MTTKLRNKLIALGPEKLADALLERLTSSGSWQKRKKMSTSSGADMEGWKSWPISLVMRPCLKRRGWPFFVI
jgi:hypothetical protein